MRDVRVIYANEAKDAMSHLSSAIVRGSASRPSVFPYPAAGWTDR